MSLLQNVTKGLRRGLHKRILVGKPEGKRPLEDQGRDGWMLKWILREVGCCGMDWIDLP
jgi:hypothetical protein